MADTHELELHETRLSRPSSYNASSHNNTDEVLNRHASSSSLFPPMDRGKAAYTALACCTIAQVPIWGYSVSFGIFQEYYTSRLPVTPGAVATIGSLQMGILYLLMPPVFFLLSRYPITRRISAPLGILVTAVSIIASAFTSSVSGLMATQGALYAAGCCLIFCPVSLAMDEWFDSRKGFAYGVMWAGKSFTGVVMPFFFDGVLNRFGLKPTLITWAVASTLMLAPTLFFLKPRVPIQQRSGAPPSFAFLRYPSFWMIQIGIVVQALGYLMPTTYLASYATDIGLPSITGPILLALFSMSSVPGGIIHGIIGDTVSATKVILASSLGSALPIFLLWGLSRHIANLVVFVLIYGFFAGGFSSTWTTMLREIQRDDAASDSSFLFGLLLGGRGVGFLLAGPLSGALLSQPGTISHDHIGYATAYGPMILCTGITALFGAWGPVFKLSRAYAPRITRIFH